MLVTDMAVQVLFFWAGFVVGLYGVVSGLRTGSSVDWSPIRIVRSENPVSYWISILINGVVGVGCLVMLIYRFLR